MASSTTNKKDLGAVTPLGTAKRERDSFFLSGRPLFFAHASPHFLSGDSGSFCIFLTIILNLIEFFSIIPYRFSRLKKPFSIANRLYALVHTMFVSDYIRLNNDKPFA